MNEKIIISILVPVYNRLETTKIGIKSLEEKIKGKTFDNIDFEVVVIDDNSPDKTYDWIKKNADWIHLLKGKGDLWWTGAINLGAMYAVNELKCDYLLLWNDDIIADKCYFDQLSKFSLADKFDVLGSLALYDRDRYKVHSFGGFFNEKSGKKGVFYINKNKNEIKENIKKVDWLPGMGTLVSKKVIKKIGYWNEKDFPQYFGDSDFTLRAKKAGFEICVSKELMIFNNVETTGLNKRTGKFNDLYKSLKSIRSVYHLQKNLKFYKIHGKSIFSFYGLFLKYFGYFGGFFKWKLINTFNKNA
jgi:GT2 family glycosyltransferase